MATRIPAIREFPKDDRYWRVDWYGAVQRKPGIPSESCFQAVGEKICELISTEYHCD